LIEEVKRVVKKARLQTEQEFSNKRRIECHDDSSDSECEGYFDKRVLRRRIEERVSSKVSRILGDAGREEQQLALVDNSSRLATLHTAEAIEQSILPELEKIAGDQGSQEEESEEYISIPGCVAQESLLEKEREIWRLESALEDERGTRRQFQARTFQAEQELKQSKLESQRWKDLWEAGEREKMILRGWGYSLNCGSSSHYW
jgi:hypothetical protein